jgi:glutamate synthase (NADPH) small chain
MPALTIDGRPVTVPEGATILDAAREAGIAIPTLCHLEGREPPSSCLVCVVRVNGSDRLAPSCATPAEEGMTVESETPVVRAARRMALELLLGDHLGECLAPCHRICPLDLDIPRMLRQVGAADLDAAIIDLRAAVPFPGITGRVCPAKCEVGCRRRVADEAVAIRSVERHVADRDRDGAAPWTPTCAEDSGKRVVVVGAGPAGLAAAYFLRLAGHAVVVLERRDATGGRLRHAFGDDLPADVLDAELAVLERLGAEIRCGVEVGTDLMPERLYSEYDSVVIAAGGIECEGAIPAGDAIRVLDDPARAMASGKDAAAAVDEVLAGRAPVARTRGFSTTIGRLTEPEMALYLRGAGAGGASDDPVAESARCLGCDCRATATCLLKKHAEDLGASATRYRSRRRLFTQDLDHPHVIHESGKCISCGICVILTREAGETLGLTFVGRGFDVRVAGPFDAPLGEALQRSAESVVKHCPTGALAFRNRKIEPEDPRGG